MGFYGMTDLGPRCGAGVGWDGPGLVISGKAPTDVTPYAYLCASLLSESVCSKVTRSTNLTCLLSSVHMADAVCVKRVARQSN
jgi:hypothetical protein